MLNRNTKRRAAAMAFFKATSKSGYDDNKIIGMMQIMALIRTRQEEWREQKKASLSLAFSFEI
jgi:hypothetical protein